MNGGARARAALAGFTAAAFLLAACAIGTSGQDRPEGLAEPTATPDTSVLKDPSVAASELAAADARLGDLIDAIAQADAERLLGLVNWERHACGIRRDVACGAAERGSEVDVVNVGWPVAFYVPRDVLAPAVEAVLSVGPLEMRFVAESLAEPGVYYMGFESEQAIKGQAPFSDPSSEITGLFFTVDTSYERPVVLIEQVSREYSAAARGSEAGFENLRLIVFDAPSAP